MRSDVADSSLRLRIVYAETLVHSSDNEVLAGVRDGDRLQRALERKKRETLYKLGLPNNQSILLFAQSILTSVVRASSCGPHSSFPASQSFLASAISASIFSTSLLRTSSFFFRNTGELRISVGEAGSPAETISSSAVSVSFSSSARRHVEVLKG